MVSYFLTKNIKKSYSLGRGEYLGGYSLCDQWEPVEVFLIFLFWKISPKCLPIFGITGYLCTYTSYIKLVTAAEKFIVHSRQENYLLSVCSCYAVSPRGRQTESTTKRILLHTRVLLHSHSCIVYNVKSQKSTSYSSDSWYGPAQAFGSLGCAMFSSGVRHLFYYKMYTYFKSCEVFTNIKNICLLKKSGKLEKICVKFYVFSENNICTYVSSMPRNYESQNIYIPFVCFASKTPAIKTGNFMIFWWSHFMLHSY